MPGLSEAMSDFFDTSVFVALVCDHPKRARVREFTEKPTTDNWFLHTVLVGQP